MSQTNMPGRVFRDWSLKVSEKRHMQQCVTQATFSDFFFEQARTPRTVHKITRNSCILQSSQVKILLHTQTNPCIQYPGACSSVFMHVAAQTAQQQLCNMTWNCSYFIRDEPQILSSIKPLFVCTVEEEVESKKQASCIFHRQQNGPSIYKNPPTFRLLSGSQGAPARCYSSAHVEVGPASLHIPWPRAWVAGNDENMNRKQCLHLFWFLALVCFFSENYGVSTKFSWELIQRLVSSVKWQLRPTSEAKDL